MEIICAWCQKKMGSIPPLTENRQISHGLCDDCKIEIEYNYLSLEKFIDKLNKPIMIVDKQVLVQGANQSTVKMSQKSKKAFKNQNPGDVVECIYADLPGGCGGTIHCSGCTIRKTVMKTHETGQSQINIEGFQFIKTKKGQKRVGILISTEKIGDLVLLQVDNLFGTIISD